MEKELTSLLIGLLILFIIYLFIQNSSACSIVHRNKKEEFNVGGRMTTWEKLGLGAVGLGTAATGVGLLAREHARQGAAVRNQLPELKEDGPFNDELPPLITYTDMEEEEEPFNEADANALISQLRQWQTSAEQSDIEKKLENLRYGDAELDRQNPEGRLIEQISERYGLVEDSTKLGLASAAAYARRLVPKLSANI